MTMLGLFHHNAFIIASGNVPNFEVGYVVKKKGFFSESKIRWWPESSIHRFHTRNLA